MADISIRPNDFLFVLAAAFTVGSAIAQEQSAEDVTPRAIVCLHTEFLPVQESDGVIPVRLVRELGRQAVLVAARDEMGLATRDETLGEAFPEAVTSGKKDLSCKVRMDLDGTTAREDTVRIELSTGPDSNAAERAKLGTPMHANFDATLSVAKLTNVLETKSRDELVKRLGIFGFAGKSLDANESNRPPESIEELLLEMNFVSQFAAVRAAHSAIREKGQSSAWLGVLARGYAHLGLMTAHHWRSDNEAFNARALLYAERMLNADPKNPLARAHRAYVRALIGLHAAALVDLGELEKGRGDDSGATPLPVWVDLIRPFCSFQREPIRSIADRRPSLRQIAQRLSFEQHRAFGDDRWLFESAGETMRVCPDEYGIYAALTGEGAPLAVGRVGANYGPAALARFLPGRIAKLPGLPGGMREVFGREDASEGESGEPTDDGDEAAGEDEAENNRDDEGDEEGNDDAAAEGDAEPSGESPIIEIVRTLREATINGGDESEPSWSALGALIAEEQFVQVANYLNISTNATESSLA
jgi:hypothetical protein